MRETEHLCPRSQTIVLSPQAGATPWGDVLNCGGYDLLPMPLEPHEVYAIVPMAWRQWALRRSLALVLGGELEL